MRPLRSPESSSTSLKLRLCSAPSAGRLRLFGSVFSCFFRMASFTSTSVSTAEAQWEQGRFENRRIFDFCFTNSELVPD